MAEQTRRKECGSSLESTKLTGEKPRNCSSTSKFCISFITVSFENCVVAFQKNQAMAVSEKKTVF